jgi:hypothetical protein
MLSSLPLPARRGGSVVEWEADESSTGPASLMLIDPDGNPVRDS